MSALTDEESIFAFEPCPMCYGDVSDYYDCDTCHARGWVPRADEVTHAQVKAALFAREIRRAERRRANGFEEYRLRDGLYPGTFYEIGDRFHWASMRLLVALGVGRLRKWLGRML